MAPRELGVRSAHGYDIGAAFVNARWSIWWPD